MKLEIYVFFLIGLEIAYELGFSRIEMSKYRKEKEKVINN